MLPSFLSRIGRKCPDTCDDTFSLVSLVSDGLGIGVVPEWTKDLPNRGFELKKLRGWV